MSERTDAIWVSNGLPGITDPEINVIIADTLEPALRNGDFAGAAIATAEALGTANEAPVPTPVPTTTPVGPSDGGDSTGGAGFDLGILLGIVLVVVGLAFVARWLLARQATRREAEERVRRTEQLARDANAGLIAIDERTRTADQEAGYVEAEFGDAEAAPFHAAIADAREELRAAFAVRQKLDDAEPEDPPTREAMLKEIVERCGRAGAALDRQAARIEELRNLERNAATILEALPAKAAAQEARLAGASATLAGLQAYAEPAWTAVKGNVEEAQKGLAGARAAIEQGKAAVARNESQAAAHEILTAQEGVAGATALLDAVDKLAATIHDTEGRLADELKAAEADLTAAKAAVPQASRAGGSAAHAADLAAAEEALRSASAAAAMSPLDPIAAHRLATSAHRGASEALAAVRSDAEQEARFTAALEASLASAKADVDRAADFIASRRNGVGREARTRLAEAERSLQNALATRATDPKAAMDEARRAERLAEEAYSLATADFDDWDRGGPGAGGRGGGSDIAGAILGGVIGGILSGGGRGGGWGGSPWGSSGPFGGGGGGWGGGHSGGGGFGGGGGGGHSQGGRW